MDLDVLEAYKQVIFQGSDFQGLKKTYDEKEFVNQEDINNLLQIAIVDEQLAEFNYLISYSNSKTEGKTDYDPQFEAHEKEEYEHKHKLINRLRELNAPRLYTTWSAFPLNNSAGSKWQQESSVDSFDILNHRYREELGAIDFYNLVINVIERVKNQTGNFDSTTYDLIKQIKADEEEHAKDLKQLIDQK